MPAGQPEPRAEALVASILQGGAASDPAGIRRDLVAIVGRYFSLDRQAAGAMLGAARERLNGSPLLTTLDDIEQRAQTADGATLPFGPVAVGDAAAVDRFALLAQLCFLAPRFAALLDQAIADLVRASGDDQAAVVIFGRTVQDRLGGQTLDGLRWRDMAVPRLLVASFDDGDLVVAATGGPLPAAWGDTAAWISPWVEARRSLDPRVASAEDRFLAGAPVPAALHPLVLRIVAPRVRELLAPETTAGFDEAKRAEALAFCAFLTDRAIAADALVAADPTWFPPAASPGSLLAAGALLLRLAVASGAALAPDGDITGGMPELAGSAGRALDALIFGSEAGPNPLPESWQDKERLRDLLGSSPEWSADRFGGPLRARVRARARSAAAELDAALPALAARIPGDALRTDVDGIAGRPARDDPHSADTVAAVRSLGAAISAIRGISDEAAQVRATSAGRLAGLLSEPELPLLLPAGNGGSSVIGAAHGTVGTVVTGLLAGMSAAGLGDAVLAKPTWTKLVNADAADADAQLQCWAALEPWDGLRGRLVRPRDAADEALSGRLLAALPGWLTGPAAPPADPGLAGLRPILAAVALLGLQPGAGTDAPGSPTLLGLVARLDALLDPAVTLPGEVAALLAAARIELTLTLVTASRRAAIGELFGSIDRFALLAKFGQIAFARPVAWEARAGFGAFLLLARMAEVTGNPELAQLADGAPPPAANELVGGALARLVAPAPGPDDRSGLPLALAAAGLTRFARESMRGITAPLSTPSWLGSAALPDSLRGDSEALAAALAAAFAAPDDDPLARFAWGGGRAGRALLLAVHRIRLRAFATARRLTVDPLRESDQALRDLRGLAVGLRSLFAVERLLLAGLPPAARDDRLVPWWSVRFWSGPDPSAVPPAAAGGDRDLAVVNWAAAAVGDLDADQLRLAATLSGEIPARREGEPLDIDGRSEFALPGLSFSAAKKRLDRAADELQRHEERYLQAVLQQSGSGQQNELIELLRQPLALSTADAGQQVELADAEVRVAEALLVAAGQELAASELEHASAELIYAAAKQAIDQQKTRTQISELEKQAAQAEADAQQIAVDEAAMDPVSAGLIVERAKLVVEKARLQVRQAVEAQVSVKQKVELLKVLLVNSTPVDIPPGQARGLIGKMGMQISAAVSQRLDEARDQAQGDLQAALAEEAHRRALERERSFLGAIFKAVGGIVGFVVGGPAGATIGSALGGAIGDVVGGIIAHKPVEELAVGLLMDAFTAAKAAGVNIDGILADVGKAVGNEADQLYGQLDSALKPVLASLPGVIDAPALRDAFKDLATAGLPAGGLIDTVVSQLKTQSGPIADIASALAGAGMHDPVALGDPGSLPATLVRAIRGVLDGEDGAGPLVSGLRRVTGADELSEISDRLSTLVLTRLGAAAEADRRQLLTAWMLEQQRQRKQWNDVAAEGSALLERLFPDPVARSEVQSRVEASLVDPSTLESEVQALLVPWQQELDRRIADMRDAGEAIVRALPPNAGAVQVAKARLDYVNKSEERFAAPDGLAAFLRGDGADQRDQLVQQLQDRIDQSEAAATELQVRDIDFQGAEIDANLARIALAKARAELDRVTRLLDAFRLRAEAASWDQKLNELAELRDETIADAQAKASDAAKAREEASRARLDAAGASLEGRRAAARGARLRASESSRIRDALSRPPLWLNPSAAITQTMALSASNHLAALESGLSAARELLRLQRAMMVDPASMRLESPVLIGFDAVRWSDFLNTQSTMFEDAFQKTSPTHPETRPMLLGEEQRDALLREGGGLRLILRPGVTEAIVADRAQRGIGAEDARNGRILAILLFGRFQDGQPIASGDYGFAAEYQGDHWISVDTLRQIEVQRVSPSRLDIMPPDEQPHDFLDHGSVAHAAAGDPTFENVPGTPVSGTTLLRLTPINGRPIAELSLIVFYNTLFA